MIDTPSITRRGLLGTLASSGGLALLPGFGCARKGAAADRSVVFVSWGGLYQRSQKAAFCEPFARDTATRVIQDGPMSTAKLRTMVAYGEPDWDVCDVNDTFFFNGARHNLFERIDYSIVNRSAVRPEYTNDFGVGVCVWSYNITYNSRAFAAGAGPKTWADVFDVGRFPGKRGLRDQVYSTLEIALLADGVAPGQLYPLDVDRAFRKLDSIKQHITWWNTPSQAQQLFIDGAVSCGVMQNGRAYDAVHKGAPLAIEWDQHLSSTDYLIVPRGSPASHTAMQLMNRAVGIEAQARFANLTAYAPVNLQALPFVDAAVRPWLSTTPENAVHGKPLDAVWWNDNLESLTNRWLTWKLA